MFSITKTAALSGIEGIQVAVEVDSARGLPAFNVIGLGDRAVKEAADRVKGAIQNSGLPFPKGRVTVNLSPAWVHKRGSHFDLAIAMGVMATTDEWVGKFHENRLLDKAFIGELALDGRLIPVKGILPMMSGLLGKVKEIYLPEDNGREAYLATKGTEVKLICVKNLVQLMKHLSGEERLEPYEDRGIADEALEISHLDFSDVKGHWAGKEAITVAVAGSHGLLMLGSPGTGKTMLAKRIPTILPDMTAEEKLETSMVYSLAGALDKDFPIVNQRPFRQLNKRITSAGILGGGYEPLPGEVSMANNGVLFIDEFLEFSREQIELLRKPMEEKHIGIMRRGQVYDFPAKFILVGATNPCRCGYLGDLEHQCRCTQREIDQYRGRISGPILERIDMCVEISRVNYRALTGQESDSSKVMKEKVMTARAMQKERFKGLNFNTNSEMVEVHIGRFCILEKKEKNFMKEAYEKYKMSPRRYHKVLKLARTVADLAGEERIAMYHLAAALNYTRFFTGFEKE